VFASSKDPGPVELARLVHLYFEAAWVCTNAKHILGEDVYGLFKRFTRNTSTGLEVRASELYRYLENE